MTEATAYKLDFNHQLLTVTLLPRVNEIPWSDIEHAGAEVIQRIHSTLHPKVLVDVTPLDYMGSAQVALIVRLFKAVKEKNGEMAVAVAHPVVLEVLTLAGLDKIWTIVRTREEGIEALGGETGSVGGDSVDPLAWVGLACAAISLILVVVLMMRIPQLPYVAGMWTALLTGLAAFALGLMTVLNSSGARRNMGAVVLVLGVLGLLGSVFLMAAGPRAVVAPKPPVTELGEPAEPAKDAVVPTTKTPLGDPAEVPAKTAP